MLFFGTDCMRHEPCEIISSFLNHLSYKYAKYKQELVYILTTGSLRLVHL